MNLNQIYSKNTLKMKSSMIRELVEMITPEIISFAGGFPAPETFPKELLAKFYYDSLIEKGETILQYGSTGGDKRIKSAIVDLEKRSGVSIDDDEIFVCSGSTNGIFTLMHTVLEENDDVITESPSFLGSLIAFEAFGANLIPVAMDDEGLLVDDLQHKITKKTKFIYTIPDFQNPTGISMTYERRKKLIEIAAANNLLILEDDPYSKLRYSGTPIKSIFEIARNEYKNEKVVVTMRSFSKILGPGLRIAYAMGDRDLIKKMASWGQKINISTERVTQEVVARFLEQNELDKQLKLICDKYKPLCEQMLTSLAKYMPDSVEWTSPAGGMFLWLQLPEDINSDLIFRQAIENKVAFIPGSKFYPQGYEKYNGIRLNFTFASREKIDEGIKSLSKLF